jgi:tripartite-type tricarboxylate transporter receptor subunit TctC
MKTTFSHFLIVALGLALIGTSPTTTRAEDFYKGKTIRFIVGFAAGGGYDAYTRTIARYISRHIPGNPSTAVENMDGAGSVIAANHIYNKASRDGLTAGVFDAHNIFNHMMGDPSLRIEGRKYLWIGSPSKDSVACAIMGFTGLKSFDDIVKSQKPVKMGATRGGNTVQLPEMMNRWAGAKFNIITGYTGTATIRLAMRSKEVDGACWTWDSMRSTARAILDAKGDEQMIPFIINGKWEDPEVKNIAQFQDVFKDKDDVHAFKVWNASNDFARPFSLPPGTPKEAVQILRKAFAATMKDKDYIADAEKSKLTVDYISGEEVEKFVAEIYAIPAQVKERLSFTVRKKKQS